MKTQVVHHISTLAHIPVSADEEKALAAAFDETLQVVDTLQQVDVTGVDPTHQVTGLVNVLREDVVDTPHMFTQAEALANARQTYQGYIVVPQILDQE